MNKADREQVRNLNHTLMTLEKSAWDRYAAPRFPALATEQKARLEFIERLHDVYHALDSKARRCGQKLDFTEVKLRHIALQALEVPCVFCFELFGYANLGATWSVPAAREMSPGFKQQNVVICCETCAIGKGSLCAGAWLDIVQVLKVEEPKAAREMLEALVAGRKAVDRRKR